MQQGLGFDASILRPSLSLQVMRPDDMVWVHDYHLMLLPKLLRDRRPEEEAELRIGWFLHTPFPSSELFRLLPFRAELLAGLLSANLLGFHVDSYMRHFFSACVQTLGLEVTDRGVLAAPVGGVYARCAAIPIGIDSESFISQASSPQVQKAAADLRRELGNRRVGRRLVPSSWDFSVSLTTPAAPRETTRYNKYLLTLWYS